MKHLRYLKLVNFVMAALAVLLGVGALVSIFVPLGCSSSGVGTISVVGGTVSFGALLVLAAAHVIVGFLVSGRRGRLAQTILAALQLFKFPLGTIFGAYALWVCWINSTTKAAFSAKVKPPIA